MSDLDGIDQWSRGKVLETRAKCDAADKEFGPRKNEHRDPERRQLLGVSPLKQPRPAPSHRPMDRPAQMTMFTCDPEAAMIADLIAQQAAEERDRDARLDLRSRLHDGPCDLCCEDSAVGLVLVGDDALCPGCAEAIGVDFNEAREEAWIPVFPAEA